MAQDVQTAFYDDLVKTPSNQQVIILENKEPPDSIKSAANYYHFSGAPGVGRTGFYPIAE